MPVNGTAFEQFKFVHHLLFAVCNVYKGHHFAEPYHTPVIDKWAHLFGREMPGSIGLKPCCRHAGGNNSKDTDWCLVGLVQEHAQSLSPCHIHHLVRIGNDGSSAMKQHNLSECFWQHH